MTENKKKLFADTFLGHVSLDGPEVLHSPSYLTGEDSTRGLVELPHTVQVLLHQRVLVLHRVPSNTQGNIHEQCIVTYT